MSLNIKNPRTHALVRELAQRTGTSQTSAVEDAVARRLAELTGSDDDHDARIDLALTRARAALDDVDRVALRHAEADLYDDAGLPR